MKGIIFLGILFVAGAYVIYRLSVFLVWLTDDVMGWTLTDKIDAKLRTEITDETRT